MMLYSDYFADNVINTPNEFRRLCIAYSKRRPGPSDAGHEHWGSCDTLREEAPVYPRALCYKEGPAPGWGLLKLCHHRGRAFPQIGKRARHLPVGKL
jgi:hypothetical protein